MARNDESIDMPSAKEIRQIAGGLARAYLSLIDARLIDNPNGFTIQDVEPIAGGFEAALTEFVSHIAGDS